MTENMQQIRKNTPEEDIRELYHRIAKLNDITSALLAPQWGAEAGIIREGHPLHPAQQTTTLEVVRDEQTPGAIHELAAAVRDLTSAIRLEIADRAEPQAAPASDADEPAPELVQVGWYCWRCKGLVDAPCRSDSVPVSVPADWAGDMEREINRLGEEDD